MEKEKKQCIYQYILKYLNKKNNNYELLVNFIILIYTLIKYYN